MCGWCHCYDPFCQNCYILLQNYPIYALLKDVMKMLNRGVIEYILNVIAFDIVRV